MILTVKKILLKGVLPLGGSLVFIFVVQIILGLFFYFLRKTFGIDPPGFWDVIMHFFADSLNVIFGYSIVLCIVYGILLRSRWLFFGAGLIIFIYVLISLITPIFSRSDPRSPAMNPERSQNPKFSCKRDSDCQLYCEGAYSKVWMAEKEQRAWDEYEKKEYGAGIVIPPNIHCFVGCVSRKGGDAACVDHQCVAIGKIGPFQKFDSYCSPLD